MLAGELGWDRGAHRKAEMVCARSNDGLLSWGGVDDDLIVSLKSRIVPVPTLAGYIFESCPFRFVSRISSSKEHQSAVILLSQDGDTKPYNLKLPLESFPSYQANMSNTQQSQAGSSATRNFFGAIKENIRGRSRSRSPAPAARSSETAAPRVQQPQQQKPVHKQPQRPAATPVPAQRPTSQSTSRSSTSTERSDFHRYSYGRHSSNVCLRSILAIEVT